MASNVKALGILHIAFGALSIVVGLMVLVFFGAIASFVGMSDDSDGRLLAVPILGGIGGLIFLITFVLGLPGIIAGVGLLYFKPWARILTIVLSALDLVHFPLGTLLGVFGLWVLLSAETEALFRNRLPAPMRAIS